MIAAVTASPLGVLIAFGAGIISFLSPCVLPLVPGYVSMVSGLSAAELGQGTGSAGVPIGRLVRDIGLFVAGFTVVFVALGAAASGIGRLLVSHKETLTHVSGFVVIALGLFLLLGAVPARTWSRLGAGPLGVLTRINGERITEQKLRRNDSVRLGIVEVPPGQEMASIAELTLFQLSA